MKLFSLLLVTIMLLTSAFAGSRSERREAAVAESAKVRSVLGAEKFTVPMPAEKAFSAIVTALGKADYDIAEANKDSGVIATAITIEGGWRQTGSRLVVTVISSSDNESLIKVVATNQKRFKALQVEPWGDPVANESKTAAASQLLRNALGVK